jgi:putative NADH-flavin reductase
VKIAVLGATGRTGRPLVEELLRRGHHVVAVVRDPAGTGVPDGVEVVPGDVRDADVLRRAVAGADAVVSALGPRKGDPRLHREVAPLLVGVMRESGVRRFVGVSGAGVDADGDHKSRRDRIISGIIKRLPGDAVKDKVLEYQVWRDSALDWTLVRPPRLQEGPPTGAVEHHAGTSPRSTAIRRSDLAAFLADEVEQGRYVGKAPLVAEAR